MTDIFEQTAHFSSQVCGLERPGRPTLLDPERLGWFRRAVFEELEELFDAPTVTDQADAVLDIMYFAAGRLHEMGLDPRVSSACLDAIHEANMLKQRGELAKRPGSAGHDAMKPKGWRSPDLYACIFGSRPRVRVLVMGYAGHGKDTVGEMLAGRGYRFTSSSLFCAERVVFPALKDKYGYGTAEECFRDRANHRAEWYDLISEYNADDEAALGRAIFAENDVYCGVRNKREFHAMRAEGVFDVAVWVDASPRVPREDASSCTVEPWMADFVVDNNGPDVEALRRRVDRLFDALEDI